MAVLTSFKKCYALQFGQLGCCCVLALAFASQAFRFVIWKPLDLDASAGSQNLRRAQEIGALDAGNEVEHVTTNTAPETFVYLLGRMHGEGWRLFQVEWAQAEKVLAALSQFDVFASERHEVIALADLFHGFGRNGH